MTFLCGVCVATFGLFSGEADGLTITYGPANLGSTPTDFSGLSLTPTLSQFDPNLGNLISVTLEYRGTVTGSMTFTNDNPNNTATVFASSQIQASLEAFLVGGPGTSLVTVLPAATINRTLTLDPAGTAGDTQTVNGLISSATNTATYTDAATLAYFIGTGSLAFEANGLGLATAATSGNVSTASVINASAELYVHYEYTTETEVPEPTAGSVVLLLLAGAAARFRRDR